MQSNIIISNFPITSWPKYSPEWIKIITLFNYMNWKNIQLTELMPYRKEIDPRTLQPQEPFSLFSERVPTQHRYPHQHPCTWNRHPHSSTSKLHVGSEKPCSLRGVQRPVIVARTDWTETHMRICKYEGGLDCVYEKSILWSLQRN